jgi:hypothetical protein
MQAIGGPCCRLRPHQGEFQPWLRFDASPPLGEVAPDFPLWDLEGAETQLSAVWSQHTYTVVEFGSFT